MANRGEGRVSRSPRPPQVILPLGSADPFSFLILKWIPLSFIGLCLRRPFSGSPCLSDIQRVNTAKCTPCSPKLPWFSLPPPIAHANPTSSPQAWVTRSWPFCAQKIPPQLHGASKALFPAWRESRQTGAESQRGPGVLGGETWPHKSHSKQLVAARVFRKFL